MVSVLSNGERRQADVCRTVFRKLLLRYSPFRHENDILVERSDDGKNRQIIYRPKDTVRWPDCRLLVIIKPDGRCRLKVEGTFFEDPGRQKMFKHNVEKAQHGLNANWARQCQFRAGEQGTKQRKRVRK